jgi:osmoprotectant transport system permease protein
MTWVLDHVGELLATSAEHLWLALVPVLVGLLISLPLGAAAARWRVLRRILVPAFGLLYTVPSLALFVVMPALLGTRILDPINVQAALTIYTVALLVRAISDALAAVPGETIAAANAMGFGQLRRFATVELPLALPVLFAGVRVAAVSNISLVSVGAIIGVGGLGYYITHGAQLALPNYSEIVAGIVLIVVLALLVDLLLSVLARAVTPWTRAVGR